MPSALSFSLKLKGTDKFEGLDAVSTSFRVRGSLRLEHDLLVIEWSGIARVQQFGPSSLRDDRLPLPDERLIVPVGHLSSATLAGGWFRPRLELQARTLGALGEVPTELHGTVRLWYARADRRTAMEMAAALTAAIESAA